MDVMGIIDVAGVGKQAGRRARRCGRRCEYFDYVCTYLP